jgi:hypothetical protein
LKYIRLQHLTVILSVYAFLGFVGIILLYILFGTLLSWNFYLYGFISSAILSAFFLYRKEIITEVKQLVRKNIEVDQGSD